MLFGCEVGAKSSTLEAMIPQAEETGRCEIRSESTVVRIQLDEAGRARRVLYLDREGSEHIQETRAVIIAGNGAETARLLLMSEENRYPDGLANSSGRVGKYLMFNGQPTAYGRFEHPLNEFKGPMVSNIIHDFYNSDPKRGFYGGGGIDARFMPGTPIWFSLEGLPGDAPTWGADYKRMLGEYYNHTVTFNGHTTSLPVETNSVSLDPEVKDKWGRPGLRITYKDHPDDMAIARFMQDRCKDLLDAAGAEEIWAPEYVEQKLGAHLLGTCRMGHNPEESVVDRYHRTHDISNLFICDGSSMVTSGRGQPTMTIMALAFRAAEHIADFAQKGEI
jgi:choline dehydrogenase-like flavoprotein